MANNPIQGSDLIDANSVKQEFDKVIEVVKEAKTVLKDLAKSSKEALSVKGTAKQQTDAIEKQADEVDKLTDEYKKLTKAEQDLLKLQKKLADSTSDDAKKTAELRVQIQEANKVTKQAARERLGLIGAYEKESKRLISLRKQYKDLVISQGSSSKSARKLKKEVVALDNKLKKLDASVGQNQRSVGKYSDALKGAVGSLIGPLGIAGAIALSIRAFKGIINITKNFESTMSEVRAISGATGDEFKLLESDALKLGKSTSFTASEVGKLQVEFAKLGFSTQEILNATESTLNLAKVSKVDLAEAAKVTGATVRGFGLDVTETQRVIDVMAKSFSSTALDMSKFSTAMSTVAPVAKNAGFTIEETTAFIGSLADAGVDASTAGSALRNIFLDIAKSGITLEEALERINNGTVKNVEALNQFGKRGATVATILAETTVKAEGLTKSFEDSAGAAALMASIMEDNLEGDLAKLSSAFEGLILGEGQGFNDFIRDTVQFLTQLINNLDPVIVAFSELFSLLGELGNEFALLLVELGLVTEETDSAAGIMEIFAFAIRSLTLPLKLVARGLIFLVKLFRQFKDSIKPVIDSIKEFSSNILDKLAPALIFLGLKAKEATEADKELTEETENLTEATEDETDATDKSTESTNRNTKSKKKSKTATELLTAEINALKKALDDQALASDINSTKLAEYLRLTKELEAAQTRLKQATEDATTSIDGITLAQATSGLQIKEQIEEIPELSKEKIVGLTDAQKEAVQTATDFSLGALDLTSQVFAQGEERKLQALQQRLDDGIVSEEEFAEQEREIRIKAAKQQRVVELFQATISGIRAVIEAGGLTPLGIATGIFNAAQIAILAAAPLPSFEKGGIYDPETGDIGGKSHAQGGTKFYNKNGVPQFEAQKGEKLFILNDKAVPYYDWMNSQKESDIPTNSPHDHLLMAQLKKNGNVGIKNAEYLAQRIGLETAKQMNNFNYYDNRYR